MQPPAVMQQRLQSLRSSLALQAALALRSTHTLQVLQETLHRLQALQPAATLQRLQSLRAAAALQRLQALQAAATLHPRSRACVRSLRRGICFPRQAKTRERNQNANFGKASDGRARFKSEVWVGGEA